MTDSLPNPISPEEGENWDDVAEGVLERIKGPMERHVQAAADRLYESLMYGVQDYLSDNVRFNIASRIATYKATIELLQGQHHVLADALRYAHRGLTSDFPETKDEALRTVKAALDATDEWSWLPR